MKFSVIVVSFFLFMLCITHVLFVQSQCPQPVPEKFSHVKSGNVVAAYVGSWDKYSSHRVAEISDIEPIADILTHIMYAFATPNDQTDLCDLLDPWADVGANSEHRKKVGGHFGQLLALKKKYPHLKILLSVGGGKSSTLIFDIAQRGKIKPFVQSAVDLLDAYEYAYEHTQLASDHVHRFEYPNLFDGIDFDWEWTNALSMREYILWYEKIVELFAQALQHRSKSSGKKSWFTCALQSHYKLLESFNLGVVAQYIDWFHVMTYDFGGANAAGVHMNAPICNQWSKYSVDTTISALMEYNNVSPEKIVLGIPMYGRVYDQAQEKLGSSFEKTEKTKVLSYAQIKELYIDNPACKTKWHKKTQVPYVYCPDESIFVSYDDARSVAVKVQYAKDKKLRGVFFWRLALDDEEHSLVRAVTQ
jgi:chitinase